MTKAIQSIAHGQRNRRKVKTGCKTCKNRKVKCDEGRPSCRRCINAGRVCGGYGIWGGGGVAPVSSPESGASSAKCSVQTPKQQALISMPHFVRVECATPVDANFYEWFKFKTSTKLSGAFQSDFWTSVVFKATIDQPAVMHAVLALSSIQKIDMYDGYNMDRELYAPDTREQYALNHYNTAVSHVRQNVSIGDRQSVRTALITCILFAALELFRGRTDSARIHLGSGVVFWAKSRANSAGIMNHTISVDDAAIVEALYRLYALTNLFNRSIPQFSGTIITAERLPKTTFTSIAYARRHLDYLLLRVNQVTYATEHVARALHTLSSNPLAALPIVLSNYRQWVIAERQQRALLGWLNEWHSICTQSTASFRLQAPAQTSIALCLLWIYHRLAFLQTATIITSLYPRCNEMIYDSYLSDFLYLLDQSDWLISKVGPGSEAAEAAHGPHSDSAAFLDMAWLPPLYFVALKCRRRSVRHHAMDLLYLSQHRESAWDARVLAPIAARIIYVEEIDFYQSAETTDGETMLIEDILAEEHQEEDILPKEYRVRNVSFSRPDGPTAKVMLSYLRMREDGGWQKIVEEGNLRTATWIEREAVDEDA